MKKIFALVLSVACAFMLFSCSLIGGENPGGGDTVKPTLTEQIAVFKSAVDATNPTSSKITTKYVTEEYTLGSVLNITYNADGTSVINYEIDRLGTIGEDFIVTSSGTLNVNADGSYTDGTELDAVATATAIKLNLDESKLVDTKIESGVLFAKVYTADSASVLGVALDSTSNISVVVSGGKVCSLSIEYYDNGNKVTVNCEYN